MGWQNSIFSLIIINAGGGFSGLFVYSPTPGAGNLIASIAGAAGTDPYGNAYPAGAAFGTASVGQTKIPPSGRIQLAGADGNNVIVMRPDNSSFALYSDPPGLGALLLSMAAAATTDAFGNAMPQGLQVLAGNYQITPAGFFVYSGTPATGNLIMSVAAAGGTDSFGNTYVGGVTAYTTGSFIDAIQLSGATATFYAPLVSGQNVSLGQTAAVLPNPAPFGLTMYGTGAASTSPVLSACDPGSLTVPEKWHTFTLAGGCTAGTDINGTAYPPSYKLLPDGNVALRGVVVAPAGGLASGTTWAVIPAAYRPGTNIPVSLISNGSHGTLAHVYIRPNGNCQFNSALGATVSMFIDCILNVAGT